jgi:hypothetical protein
MVALHNATSRSLGRCPAPPREATNAPSVALVIILLARSWTETPLRHLVILDASSAMHLFVFTVLMVFATRSGDTEVAPIAAVPRSTGDPRDTAMRGSRLAVGNPKS